MELRDQSLFANHSQTSPQTPLEWSLIPVCDGLEVSRMVLFFHTGYSVCSLILLKPGNQRDGITVYNGIWKMFVCVNQILVFID